MVPLVVLAVFVAFGLAVLWRPASIIALTFCVYSFEQWAQANSVYFQKHPVIINYGYGALVVLAVTMVFLRGKNPLQPITNATWSYLALYVLAAVSCVWSIDREISLFVFKYHFPYIVTFVGLVPLVVQDSRDVRFALKLTLFFGVAVMLLLLVDTQIHAWGRTIEVEEGFGVANRLGVQRTRLGVLTVPDMAGLIMLIGVMLNFVGIGRVWQLLRWLVVLVALALIVRSQSRGQLIGVILAATVMIPYSRANKRLTGVAFAAAAVILTLAALWFAFGSFGDTSGRWTLETMEKTFRSTRLEASARLLKYWFESGPFYWVFGIGSSASYDVRVVGSYCHIVIVEVLGELGVFGLCVYALFLVLVAKDAIYLLKVSKSSAIERGVAAALVAVLLFRFILCFKQGSFLTHPLTFGWALIVSRTAAIRLMEKDREKSVSWQRWYAQFWPAALPAASPQPGRPS